MNPLSAAAWVAAFFLCANLFSHTVALRLLLLLLGLALVAAAIWKDRHALRIIPPLWLPFLAWGAWAALSPAWSLEPARSLKEFQNEIGYCGLAFWFCYLAAQAESARRAMLWIASLGALAVCAVAGYYFTKGFWIYSTGPHGGSGNHSSALLTMMPCALLLAWYAHRNSWAPALRYLPWVAVGIFLLSGYATYNRTIWLGFAAEFFLIGLLMMKRRTAQGAASLGGKAKMIAAILALAVVAGAGAMLYQVQASRVHLVKEVNVGQDPRLELWLAIVDRIEERPLTGYGFGRGMFRGVLRKEMDNLNLWHSHNLLLDITLQLGLPGLVLLLLLLAATIREGWRRGLDADDAAAACGIAIVAIVAGMLVRNMTDVLWVRQNSLLYWGVLGVLFAWSSGTASRPKTA